MVAPLTIALTGGTGFVGARTLQRALAAGHQVRALARQAQDERAGVTWIAGSLEDKDSLSRLSEGADAVIHVAGVLNAPDAAGFEAGNVAGTANMLVAASRAGVDRFVHVSSLAAREPQLSHYGASKARSEPLVCASGLDAVIVRPPAIYGPGDRETLDLFRMAKAGLVILPPEGRLSLIHVDDLADLLLALATERPFTNGTLEPDDGSGGYRHKEFAALLGQAVGRKVAAVSTPAAMLRLGARLDRLVRGSKAKLTLDRAAYFAHPNWVASPQATPPAQLWQAKIATPEGLKSTADWYRLQGWL